MLLRWGGGRPFEYKCKAEIQHGAHESDVSCLFCGSSGLWRDARQLERYPDLLTLTSAANSGSSMATSASLETVMSCGRTGPAAPPKSLAFSIDRIMAKSVEPRRSTEERTEGKKVLGLCSPIPCMIPLQPFSYDLQAKALMNYTDLWRASFRGALCGSAPAPCKGGCAMCGKEEPGLKQPLLAPGSRVVKPQVIHQAVAVPSCGSLYYLNYLDSAYQQSELLAGHWLSGPQAQASLSAHHRLLLLENAKLSGVGAEKLPTPQYPHKEHLPGQLDQIVKENQSLSSEKSAVKAHSRLSGGSGVDGKHKNFTCEVCGKVKSASASMIFNHGFLIKIFFVLMRFKKKTTLFMLLFFFSFCLSFSSICLFSKIFNMFWVKIFVDSFEFFFKTFCRFLTRTTT